ncbi:hypothetical protein GCM10020256_29190 [Streptomyces thermocoprophilus]
MLRPGRPSSPLCRGELTGVPSPAPWSFISRAAADTPAPATAAASSADTSMPRAEYVRRAGVTGLSGRVGV